MRFNDAGGRIDVETSGYLLSVDKNDLTFATLTLPDRSNHKLFLPSSIDSSAQEDCILQINYQGKSTLMDDGVQLQFVGQSQIWDRVEYFLECTDKYLAYYYRVLGSGDIEAINYFQGRYGPQRYKSSLWFDRVFVPQPNMRFRQYWNIDDYVVITCSQAIREEEDSQTQKYIEENNGVWAFNSVPYLFGFQGQANERWYGFSLLVREGQHNFVDYRYEGNKEGAGLSLTYEGHTKVCQEFETPRLMIHTAKTEFNLSYDHVRHLRKKGLVSIPADKRIPRWWFSPLKVDADALHFWAYRSKRVREGLSVHNISADNLPSSASNHIDGKPVDFAPLTSFEIYETQYSHVSQVEFLSGKGISPRLIVFDVSNRFFHSGEFDPGRFSDMSGLIDKFHREGRRVLIWAPIWGWGALGVPIEECITTRTGKILGVDPSNPIYEDRLRKLIRKYLSSEEGCYNADGFFMDFIHHTPCGKDVNHHGDIWGNELVKKLIWIYYDESKKAKEDSLIMHHCCNPYFTEVCDVFRLNDIYAPKGVPYVDLMTFRAMVARITAPEWVIQADNYPGSNHAFWTEYCHMEDQLGVPGLWYTHYVDRTLEELTENDYKVIRDSWTRHEQLVNSVFGKRKTISTEEMGFFEIDQRLKGMGIGAE